MVLQAGAISSIVSARDLLGLFVVTPHTSRRLGGPSGELGASAGICRRIDGEVGKSAGSADGEVRDMAGTGERRRFGERHVLQHVGNGALSVRCGSTARAVGVTMEERARGARVDAGGASADLEANRGIT